MTVRKIAKILKYPLVFIITALLLSGFLIGSAFISNDLIKDNLKSSAEDLCEKKVFFDLFNGVEPSKIDRYADSILLNIAYHYDADDPLHSVMISEYYYTPWQNENNNLLDAVNHDYSANTQYLRYWHGSAALVRILHLFTNMRGMYIINAVIAVVLYGLLAFVLIKNRLYEGAVGLGIALVAAGIWFVPFSLEYTWVFLIAPAVSIAAVELVLKGKTELLGTLFIISGMTTNFFDFLTAETVTLTVPLLLALYTAEKTNPAATREKALRTVKLIVLWGVGYAGMWVLKWGLAAAVLGEDVMPYVAEHIAERSIGNLDGPEDANILAAVWKNISCLFPFGYGEAGLIAAIVLMLGAAYVCFVYRRKGAVRSNIIIYAVIGAIPLLRYAVLMNHAFLHYFFSYRALAGTMLALCLIIFEMIGVGRVKNEAHKRKRA